MDGQAKTRASGADGGGAWGTSAGSYDRAAPTFEPFAEWLAELCSLREDMAVLDVGCGTGISSLVAARHVGSRGRVTGIDVSERMVEVARNKAVAMSWPNVQFLVRRAEQTGLPDESFDAAISNFSLHLFDDQPAAVREMTRVVRPGGRVGWTVPASDHAKEMIAAFTIVCEQLRLPVSSPGERPLKPGRTGIDRLLRSSSPGTRARIDERRQVFAYTDPEAYRGVLGARMPRLLSRVPEDRRPEVQQGMLALLLAQGGDFTFTCHAYGVVCDKA